MAEETGLKGGLRLASAVCVITTAYDGQRYGMTATSVTSLSLVPPSLLLCINRSARLHDPLIRGGAFGVNILHADDSEIAQAFSGARDAEGRFASGEWNADASGLPHLKSAQASVFCELDAISGYGTHSIMIGKVRDARPCQPADLSGRAIHRRARRRHRLGRAGRITFKKSGRTPWNSAISR